MAKDSVNPAKNTVKTRPGRNGGTLQSGNPGNKGGGRESKEWADWCKSVTEDETVRNVQLAMAKSGEIKILQLAASYAHGKPKEQVEHSGEVTITVQYDEHD